MGNDRSTENMHSGKRQLDESAVFEILRNKVKKGLTRVQLAEKFGVHPHTITQVRRGVTYRVWYDKFWHQEAQKAGLNKYLKNDLSRHQETHFPDDELPDAEDLI